MSMAPSRAAWLSLAVIFAAGAAVWLAAIHSQRAAQPESTVLDTPPAPHRVAVPVDAPVGSDSSREPIGGESVASASVHGVVLSATTKLPLLASIASGDRTTLTDAHTGAFALATALRELVVCADGFGEQVVRIDPASAHEPLRVLLEPLASMEVRVTNAAGLPVPGATVSGLLRAADARGSLEHVLGVTDAEGRCVLRDPGPALLLARTADAVSMPRLCAGGDTLVCDASSSARLRVQRGSEAIGCTLLSTLVDTRPGLRLRHELTAASPPLLLPAGIYAFEVVGRKLATKVGAVPGSFAGLQAALRPGEEVILQIADGSGIVAVRDERTQLPVEATLSLEVIEPEGWQIHGRTCATDETGRADLGPLQSSVAGIRPESLRLRVDAAGYETNFLPVESALERGVVELALARDHVTLRFHRDGAPYMGRLAIRAAGTAAAPATLLFDGAPPTTGITIALPLDRRLAVLASARREAALLATLELRRDLGGGAVDIELPAAGRIVVEGAQGPGGIVALMADGARLQPYHEAGQLVFDGLFPGPYMLGPDGILETKEPSAAVLAIELAAGEHAAVAWNPHWRSTDAVDGRVVLPAAGDVPDGGLWVLPWRGVAPRANPTLFKSAAPVRPDGSFRLPRLAFAPDVLAVYGALVGRPVLLGEFPLQATLRVEARRVVLELQDVVGKPGRLLVVAPPDATGKSVGQWLVESTSRDVVDLGYLPTAVRQVVWLAGGGAPQTIDLPLGESRVVVPLGR
jgi:hypothetical protein